MVGKVWCKSQHKRQLTSIRYSKQNKSIPSYIILRPYSKLILFQFYQVTNIVLIDHSFCSPRTTVSTSRKVSVASSRPINMRRINGINGNNNVNKINGFNVLNGINGINRINYINRVIEVNDVLAVENYGEKEERDLTEEDIDTAIYELGFNISDFNSPFREVCYRIIQEDFDTWGFVVFKTWGYGVYTQAFETYWSKLQQVKKQILRDKGLPGDLESGLASMLRWKLVEDESLNHASPAEVRKRFEEIVEDEVDCPRGVDVDIALLINSESMRSLMAPTRETPPFFIGVVRSTEEHMGGGYFKVTLDALIPHLWLLLSKRTPISEFYPGEGQLYKGEAERSTNHGRR